MSDVSPDARGKRSRSSGRDSPGGRTMFEAIVVLVVISLVVGLGLLALKVVVAVVVLPFKLLAWLLGGLLTLVLVVPLLLVVGALLVAIVPVGLVLLAVALPILLIGALVAGVLRPLTSAASTGLLAAAGARLRRPPHGLLSGPPGLRRARRGQPRSASGVALPAAGDFDARLVPWATLRRLALEAGLQPPVDEPLGGDEWRALWRRSPRPWPRARRSPVNAGRCSRWPACREAGPGSALACWSALPTAARLPTGEAGLAWGPGWNATAEFGVAGGARSLVGGAHGACAGASGLGRRAVADSARGR